MYEFNKEVVECTLEEVVRQKVNSGILANATHLRGFLEENAGIDFQFDLYNAKDVERMIEGDAILEALEDSIQKEGLEETVFIVRSNKRANLYNQQIRQRILFLEAELSVGRSINGSQKQLLLACARICTRLYR